MVDRENNAIAVSPNRQRYAVMLIRGDIANDRVEVQVICGKLTGLDDAVPAVVARLYTSGLGNTNLGDHDSAWLTMPGRNPLIWTDNSHLTFFWEDSRGLRQVVSVNVLNGQWDFLTHHETDVLSFGIGLTGTVIYEARRAFSPERSRELYRQGFAVTSADAISLLNGIADGTGDLEARASFDRFVMLPGAKQPDQIAFPGHRAAWLIPTFSAKLSPDERFAIIEDAPKSIPSDWNNYSDSLFRLQLAGRNVGQLYVIELESGAMRPLWNAPWTGARGSPLLSWSPNSRSVLIGPTVLPPHEDQDALSGLAVAEVDLDSGAYRRLPLRADDAMRIKAAEWKSSTRITVVSDSGSRVEYERVGDSWQFRRNVQAAGESFHGLRTPLVQVSLQQGLNTPPRLFGTDGAGRERLLLDLNPSLGKEISLGRVEVVQWQDDDGRLWRGRLHYPVGFTSQAMFPLVIQTNGLASDDEFSLYGREPNLGPGISVFLAQLLANQDIAVLQVDDPVSWDISSEDQLGRMQKAVASYAIAGRVFASRGLIDLNRVGLMGFSATGWNVEYALTHSDFPYAAAIASDNKDGGYVMAALFGWHVAYSEQINRVPAFGKDLQVWLNESPAFNAHRVRVPLQLQVTNSVGGVAAPVVTGWEMFSRLRALGKPTELYVVPFVQRGSHHLQNPTQLLATQQRALDWWCFWLKGHEDPEPSKSAQYDDWRRLRRMHRARSDEMSTNISN